MLMLAFDAGGDLVKKVKLGNGGGEEDLLQFRQHRESPPRISQILKTNDAIMVRIHVKRITWVISRRDLSVKSVFKTKNDIVENPENHWNFIIVLNCKKDEIWKVDFNRDLRKISFQRLDPDSWKFEESSKKTATLPDLVFEGPSHDARLFGCRIFISTRGDSRIAHLMIDRTRGEDSDSEFDSDREDDFTKQTLHLTYNLAQGGNSMRFSLNFGLGVLRKKMLKK